MKLLVALCACLTPVLILAQVEPFPQTRTALLMGSWTYDDPAFPALRGIEEDLSKMEAKLKGLGFEVTVVKNPTLARAKAAVDAFGDTLKKRGGGGLFYFSGHGSEHDGKNYLIPVGTRVKTRRDLDDEALTVNRVLGRMEESGSEVNLVFLDCCRNSMSKSGAETGLAPMSARGTFIGYATASGKEAFSTESGSPYTSALVRHLATPGLSVPDMHALVAASVLKAARESGGIQSPHEYSGLSGIFHLVPGKAVTGGSGSGSGGTSAMIKMSDDELALWIKRFKLEGKMIDVGHRSTIPWDPVSPKAILGAHIQFNPEDMACVVYADEVTFATQPLQDSASWTAGNVARKNGVGFQMHSSLDFAKSSKSGRIFTFIPRGKSVLLAHWIEGEYLCLKTLDEARFDKSQPAMLLLWRIPYHPAKGTRAVDAQMDDSQEGGTHVSAIFYFVDFK